MNGMSDLALWTRIQSFNLDKADVSLPFSARLARENGWEPEFARRVCEEYKKFIYLACVSKETMTPSQDVDEAWHLHLVYTKNYWQDFCRNTLRRDLHHTPTDGGEAEGAKFREAYERMLGRYRAEFGETPPDDIWPTADIRFGRSVAISTPSGAREIVRDPNTSWLSLALFGVIMASAIALAAFADTRGAPRVITILTLIAVLVLGLTVCLPAKQPHGRGRKSNGCGSGAGCGATGGDGGSGCGGGGGGD